MNDLNNRLINYLDEHSSIIKLSIDGKGEIVKANAFAE